MKTNKILMAVALPALLAACTAEEVVEQSPVANLSGRAVLDSNFSVNVAEGIDSRFAWEGLNWKYEAGDQFGAGVVDPAELGVISDASMIGNYIFEKNAAGAYKTNSQMQEGTYMFYSYGGFDKKNVRSLVSFDITSQKTDLSNPEAMINEYANQLMFSPLYDIEAEYSAEALPLEFRSFWGVAAFKFKNNSGQTLKINQIVLKETGRDADGNPIKFIVKGGINPKAINAAGLKYVYNEKGAKYNGTEGKANEHNYVPVAVSGHIDDKDLTEAKRLEKIEDAYEAFEKAYYNTALSKDVTGNGSASFIAMNCQNYKMEHGETVTAYMLVPQHNGGNLSVEIMVVDEEDESWSVFVEDETVSDCKEVEELDKLAILRHKTNAIFGKTTDGKGMKTLNITEDDLQENSGYYIDNNAALIDLINANLGKILVHNTGDTYVNAEVIKAIKEYTGTHVTFSNVIEIKDAEALVDDADTETELALTQITFNGGAVVKGESKKNDIKGTVEFGKDIVFGAGQTLTIEEGANVTLDKGTYKNIKNSGNLTIVGAENNGSRAIDTFNGKVTNLAGTLTLKGTTPEVDMKAGSLSYEALNRKTLVVDSDDLTIAAGVELTIGEYVTLEMKDDMTIANVWSADEKTVLDLSTWTNNGEIEIARGKVLDVEGTFENNGTITGGEIHLHVVEGYLSDDVITRGMFNNNADAVVRVENIEVDELTTVNNYGDFLATEVTNNGTIVMKDMKAHVNVTEGKGQIDNTVNGVIEELPTAGMLVYATVGAMTDGNVLNDFDEDSEINKIYVTGRWTITKEPEEDEVIDLTGIEEIEFATKDALYLRQGAALDLTKVKVKVSGVEKVVFTGYNDNKVQIGAIEYGKWWNSNDGTYGAWNETKLDCKHIILTQGNDYMVETLANGGKVTLEANVEMTERLQMTKETVLDLAGYDVVYENPGATTPLFDAKGADVTIKGEGSVEGSVLVQAQGGAEVTIEGGEWIGTYRTAYGLIFATQKSTVVIDGGYFEYTYEVKTAFDYEMILNAENGSIVVKSGVFKNYNPAAAANKYNVSLAEDSEIRVMKGNTDVTKDYAEKQWNFAEDGDLIYIVE